MILFNILGKIVWWGAALLMFVFWISALTDWLGVMGSILAFLVAPGLIVFPFVFWIVEGVFPWLYFIIYAVGMVGMAVSAMTSR